MIAHSVPCFRLVVFPVGSGSSNAGIDPQREIVRGPVRLYKLMIWVEYGRCGIIPKIVNAEERHST